jgi:Chaperone of endosialidase
MKKQLLTGLIALGLTLTINAQSWTGTASIITNTTGATVAIGDSNHYGQLHVYAPKAAPSTTSTPNGSLVLTNNFSTPVALTFGIEGSDSTNYTWIQSRDLSYATTKRSLFLNPNGGHVGIGIKRNSSSLLHTYCDMDGMSSTHSVHLFSNARTSSGANITKTGVDIQSVGTWNGTGAVNKGMNVYVAGGTTNYAATLMGGNVGIGTLSPSALLHLVSTTEQFRVGYDASNYLKTTVGSTGAMTWQGIGSGSSATFIGGNQVGSQCMLQSTSAIGTSTGVGIMMMVGNNGATQAMNIWNNGYVGIGTGTTIAKGLLEVKGSLGSTYVDNQGVILRMTRANTNYIMASDVAGSLSFCTGGSTSRINILSGGNVGIGIPNPGYKLDVAAGGGANAITIRADGTVQAGGVVLTSDKIFKKDIDSLHSALVTINRLKPKSYYFDTAKFNGKGKFNFQSAKQYGFIAQEVEIILPELVSLSTKSAILDTLGNVVNPSYIYRALNYNAFIPILTKGIQELSNENDRLKIKTNRQDSINTSMQKKVIQLEKDNTLFQSQLNQLMGTINKCCNRSQSPAETNPQAKSLSEGVITQIDVNLNNMQMIVLEQNVPNPFAEQTTINYNLPNNIVKAQMLFYNSQGKLIQSVELVQKGKGQLNVFASDLTNGTYTYSLIADGQIIDTKKMVKAQ